ncbi:MAG TPA: hypothetical protein VGH37_05530 [Candidatus Acidoferrum sp.]|jgi:hypothetical protein
MKVEKQLKEFGVIFNWLPSGEKEPHDECQDGDIVFREGEPRFLPLPGDSIDLTWGGKQKYFKVVRRHFQWSPNYRGVVIVVEEAEPDEIAKKFVNL